MSNLFTKAKQLPVAKTATAKKEKQEIALAGLQSLAEIKALMQGLEAAAATLEGEIKEAGFAEFLKMETKVRPESFKGTDGLATCSVEMRKRGTNSALNEDEVAALEAAGLTPFKQVITAEMFGINPTYAGDELLMNKVSKALEKVAGLPADFIVHQPEKSKLVVSDEVVNAAFALTGESREGALRICTTMALKPKLSADYPMENLLDNVAAILNPKVEEVKEPVEVQEVTKPARRKVKLAA